MKCYLANVEVNEYSIPLQDLVNHAIKRLLKSINYFDNKNLEDFVYFDSHFKEGCDGSFGYSEYQQKYFRKPKNEIDQQIEVESYRENYTSQYIKR